MRATHPQPQPESPTEPSKPLLKPGSTDPQKAEENRFFAMFTDLAIQKTNVLSDGAWYATEWVMTGVHTGDTPGLPATGRSFRVLGAGIGEVRDGLIAHATEYWNMADFLGQIGALPPPAE